MDKASCLTCNGTGFRWLSFCSAHPVVNKSCRICMSGKKIPCEDCEDNLMVPTEMQLLNMVNKLEDMVNILCEKLDVQAGLIEKINESRELQSNALLAALKIATNQQKSIESLREDVDSIRSELFPVDDN